jgi:hypothetical protein
MANCNAHPVSDGDSEERYESRTNVSITILILIYFLLQEVVGGVPHPLLLYKFTGFANAMDHLMFLVVALFYIVAVPFTKVEESFNLHAAHDVIMYGVGSNTLHNVSRSKCCRCAYSLPQ